jgi:hypothetical protein
MKLSTRYSDSIRRNIPFYSYYISWNSRMWLAWNITGLLKRQCIGLVSVSDRLEWPKSGSLRFSSAPASECQDNSFNFSATVSYQLIKNAWSDGRLYSLGHWPYRYGFWMEVWQTSWRQVLWISFNVYLWVIWLTSGPVHYRRSAIRIQGQIWRLF